jgi:hypothetical protein
VDDTARSAARAEQTRVAELGVGAGGGGAAEPGGRGELAFARQAGAGGDASVHDQQADLVGQVAVGNALRWGERGGQAGGGDRDGHEGHFLTIGYFFKGQLRSIMKSCSSC